jgi:hypothetical protein
MLANGTMNVLIPSSGFLPVILAPIPGNSSILNASDVNVFERRAQTPLGREPSSFCSWRFSYVHSFFIRIVDDVLIDKRIE